MSIQGKVFLKLGLRQKTIELEAFEHCLLYCRDSVSRYLFIYASMQIRRKSSRQNDCGPRFLPALLLLLLL